MTRYIWMSPITAVLAISSAAVVAKYMELMLLRKTRQSFTSNL